MTDVPVRFFNFIENNIHLIKELSFLKQHWYFPTPTNIYFNGLLLSTIEIIDILSLHNIHSFDRYYNCAFIPWIFNTGEIYSYLVIYKHAYPL